MARNLLKSDLQNLLEKILHEMEASGVLEEYRSDEDAERGAPQVRKSYSGDSDDVEPRVHKLGKKQVCGTDERGFATPGDRRPTDLVLDASEGFIPLWRYGTTLRWCFDEVALSAFENRTAVKSDVRELVHDAILAWGDSAPVKFKEERDSYDFKIVVNHIDNCSPFGCTLARAFFPDSGRHTLEIFPEMFEQSRKEQVDTITHEMGHIFGLRHFFANVSETSRTSVIFGKHKPFTIMNYGAQSELTQDDKDDLKSLYHAVWTGQLTEVNGTPIRLFAAYHEAGSLVTPQFMPT